MPFDLFNAPKTIQSMMQRILHEDIGRSVQFHLDDIVVYSSTEQEHVPFSPKVLATLEKSGIRLLRSKCIFFATEIAFLGHLIIAAEARPLLNKIESIETEHWTTSSYHLRSNGLNDRSHYLILQATALKLVRTNRWKISTLANKFLQSYVSHSYWFQSNVLAIWSTF